MANGLCPMDELVEIDLEGFLEAPEELFRAIKAAEGISDYLLEKGEFEQVMERFTPEAEPQPQMQEFELEM